MRPEIKKLAESQILQFFDSAVLASYRDRPDEYDLATDYFEGRLRSRSDLKKDVPYADIRFGFCVRRDRRLAVVVYFGDLRKADSVVADDWGHHRLLCLEELTEDRDRRFDLWCRRYIEADWCVENGPLRQIGEAVSSTNALFRVAIGGPLFLSDSAPEVQFPKAENDHAYQDAHAKLYGYLIDGLCKVSMARLALALDMEVNIASSRTLNALKLILPATEKVAILKPLELISTHRRPASHGVRPPARPFSASDEFYSDCEKIARSIRRLRDWSAEQFDMKDEDCSEYLRKEADLPKLDDSREILPNFSICGLTHLIGRKVDRVELGFQEASPDHHETEAAVLWLDDGSRVGITTVSNAARVGTDIEEIARGGDAKVGAERFHVEFYVSVVPPKPGTQGSG